MKLLSYINIYILILFLKTVLGLNIYSTLPDYIVIWLKKHIYIEIENIQTEQINKKCISINGPFCKHLRNINIKINDINTEIFRFDHLYKNNYIQNVNLNNLLYLELKRNLNETSNLTNLRLINSLDSNIEYKLLNNKMNYINKYNYININNINLINDYCKLNNIIHCLRLILKRIINFFSDMVSNLISRSISFFQLNFFKKTFFDYVKRKKNKDKKINFEKYKIIKRYDLPIEDYEFSLKFNKINMNKNNEIKYINELKDGYINTSLNSIILFNDILNNFLKSRHVKITLSSCLTWILQQKKSYIDSWNNWRNERLGNYYILNIENNINNVKFLTSPYTNIKIDLNLLNNEFHNNFRVIRKNWNGVSSKMNFSNIKPNIHLLPNNYCDDENLICEWQGIWEIYNDINIGIKLVTKFGKFYIKNEKFVVSYLPISIDNLIINNSTLNNYNIKNDETIIISGYNNYRLMWKCIISINDLMKRISNKYNEESNKNYKNKWVNALDFSDTIPYSLIDTIYFENNSSKNMFQRLILGEFVYNLLNPTFNYIPLNTSEFKNFPIEINEKSELSLVTYFYIRKNNKKDKVSVVNITTMYLSKASPMISLYNLENKGFDLKYEIDEDTFSVIKKNLVDITKE